MSVAGALLRGGAVFTAVSLALAAVSAQVASGWRGGEELPPLDPEALDLASSPERGHVERTSTNVARGDGTSAAAWIVSPHNVTAPLPGVVLIHPAGEAERDEMLAWAEAFAGAGIASISYDKRSAGYSFISRDYSRLAQDAVDAARALVADKRVDADRIGLLGYSEGGWVAPLAVQQAPEQFSFLILASPTVATPLEEVAWIVDSRIADAPQWIRRIPTGMLAGGRAFIDYLDADPHDTLTTLRTPVLAVWGAEDATSPVATSVRALLESIDVPVSAVILPHTGHDVGTGPWIDYAADWITAKHERTVVLGIEPRSHHGAPRPHDSSWILNPLLHAAIALLAAVGASLLSAPSRDRRKGTAT